MHNLDDYEEGTLDRTLGGTNKENNRCHFIKVDSGQYTTRTGSGNITVSKTCW